MKRTILLFIAGFLSIAGVKAQSLEELELAKKATKDSISRLESKLKNIQHKIDSFPGWETGASGTLGLNISNFNNWFQKDIPNSSGGAIGVTVNVHANYDEAKHYWRNAGTLNVGWVKFDDQDDPDDENGYQVATDIFNISSLYGRKLTQKMAASARVEYRSSIIDDFNDPGYLDLGIGGTWKPAKSLFCTFHPINANLVFADEESIYRSTFGAKFVADYNTDLGGGLSLTSNFSGFLSYKNFNRSNWTWTGSVNYKLWKVVGLGIEGGLRGNKQETLDHEINKLGNEDATFDTIDNKLQHYFLAGISYKF